MLWVIMVPLVAGAVAQSSPTISILVPGSYATQNGYQASVVEADSTATTLALTSAFACPLNIRNDMNCIVPPDLNVVTITAGSSFFDVNLLSVNFTGTLSEFHSTTLLIEPNGPDGEAADILHCEYSATTEMVCTYKEPFRDVMGPDGASQPFLTTVTKTPYTFNGTDVGYQTIIMTAGAGKLPITTSAIPVPTSAASSPSSTSNGAPPTSSPSASSAIGSSIQTTLVVKTSVVVVAISLFAFV